MTAQFVLVAMFASLQPDVVFALRSVRHPPAAGVFENHSRHASLQAAVVLGENRNVSIPTIVMEVPMVRVFMVADGADVPNNTSQEVSESSIAPGPGAACRGEMQSLVHNRSRVLAARACEQRTNSSGRAVASLQTASVSSAEAAVQGAFQKCGGLSVSCAKEFAPDVILKMRLSGLAVSEHCGKVAQTEAPTDKDATCEGNVTRKMIGALGHEDLEGAMSAAQHGLRSCKNIEEPCDFQLAPILVSRLLQAGEEQEMAEAFFTGLRAAEEMSAELIGSPPNASAQNLSKTAPKALRRAAEEDKHANSSKAISLISIADRVHIVSERHVVRS